MARSSTRKSPFDARSARSPSFSSIPTATFWLTALSSAARTRRPNPEGILPADFRHGASGVHYQIYEQGSQVWLNYERDDPSRELKGRLELKYFLGSGKRGRTYLFERQGYWFESPINWYAKKKIWDMAPNYLEAGEAPLALPVDPGCLHCHASGVAAAEPDARNHYAGPGPPAGIRSA